MKHESQKIPNEQFKLALQENPGNSKGCFCESFKKSFLSQPGQQKWELTEGEMHKFIGQML